MKDYKRIAVWALQIIGFFFAAFGGFLIKIAPPDQTGASYDVGIMSFFVLIVLLTISAAARGRETKAHRRRWIIAGIVCFLIALPGVILYRTVWEDNTYSYPPEKPLSHHVRGCHSTSPYTPVSLCRALVLCVLKCTPLLTGVSLSVPRVSSTSLPATAVNVPQLRAH